MTSKCLASTCFCLLLLSAGVGSAQTQRSTRQVPTKPAPLWDLASGYEVTVTGESATGQVYQSPDFRKLLVLLEPGTEGYLVSLSDGTVSSIPTDGIEYTDHGARPLESAVPAPRGRFKQAGAEISFAAGKLNVKLLPQPPLVGAVTLDTILKRKMDYARSAAGYTPDPGAVDRLKKHAKPVEIVAFFGTWCGACRKQMPKFIRTMELANNPKITVRYIAVAEDYKDPRAEIERYNMHITPSFIVMDGKRELGRIKGKPVLSVEKDLAEILDGQ